MEGHKVFALEIQTHLAAIAGICARWGSPQLGDHLTLILRDPANPRGAVIFGSADLEAVVQTIRELQAHGIRE